MTIATYASLSTHSSKGLKSESAMSLSLIYCRSDSSDRVSCRA